MTGAYRLTEAHEMVRTMARQMAREKLAPRAAEIDKNGEFPWDIIEFYRENHILEMPIPAEYGGQGADTLSRTLVIEEFAAACANSAHALADHWMGLHPIEIGGSEELKRRLLPELRKKLVAFSVTEPEAGSDVANLKTRAIARGDHYILNGIKCFCTDGAVADYIVIFAKTDPEAGSRGISAFVVDTRATGFSIGKIEDQMGLRGTRACELVLEDCAVPRENLLGREGDGFKIAMQTFDRSRPTDAILALGIAQGALSYAKEYAKQRVQFGRAIAEFQAIQFMLADMATGIEAARHLVYKAASLIDDGTPDPMMSAMANCFATDTAVKVTTDAIQVMGGYGYMRDHPVERMFRDARLFQIVEGTNQVLRIVIARSLLKK
ncbi:MAG: acyl-CoA dehydrogenase family protein [Chloroflexi bacterium]|nr:acyl-CoA dehydrogenase family protein [Chloroflexota bacterium]